MFNYISPNDKLIETLYQVDHLCMIPDVIFLKFDRVKTLVVMKVTMYPVIKAAITVPSRTPSILPAINHDRITAPVTREISNKTFVLPKDLLNLREVYFTKPSALIIATSGFISNATPTPCIIQPNIRMNTAIT